MTARPPVGDTSDELGDIALCTECDFAIQLRRYIEPTLGEYDAWEHFRVPITPHPGHPKRSPADV